MYYPVSNKSKFCLGKKKNENNFIAVFTDDRCKFAWSFGISPAS